MELDQEACYRAMRSRDRRFEGRFVVAVTSTGVYCRPGCPARIPRRANVRFLPTTAAAESAGFRPCFRCRPDASPYSPAWLGTSATVARALRLIDEGAMEAGGVEALAARLGMGARHLRRLFIERLGAPPQAIAQTRRNHFARKLIEETDLSMAVVAASAGFGSVRRFNGALRRTFGRSPRELRRTRRREAPGDALELRLPYRPPLDWPALIGFLAARAIPGVESADEEGYRRTIRLPSGAGSISVRPLPGEAALLLRVHAPVGPGLDRVVRQARRVFDLDADPLLIARDLGRDPALAPALRRHPGLRVPGAWDPFELAVRAILGQQVSVRAASTLAGRLVRAYGAAIGESGGRVRAPAGAGLDGASLLPGAPSGLTHLFPSPEDLARAELGSIGIPRARAVAIRALSGAVGGGALPLSASNGHGDVVERLCALPGIGPWTAGYVAMRALGEPDAFPAGDLVLRRALDLTPAALAKRADAWRPWRAYAAMYLWKMTAERGKRE